MHKIENKFTRICDEAEKKCKGLERFSGYFNFKKAETLLVVERAGLTGKELILEIGCGTGFQSLLLSECCDWLVSTDLPNFSKTTHTIGIRDAQEMALRLGASNVKHLGCSIVDLPFKDGAFDCVFSSGVLEHICDKNAALKEMKRVVKNKGIIICTVPTYVQTIFQFSALYFYMAKRVYDAIRNRLFKKDAGQRSIFSNNASEETDRGPGKLIKTFLLNNPNFPLPCPHGDWRDKKGKQSIFVEFNEQLPWKWKKMFLNNGLCVRKSFAVLFIPFMIIEIFSPELLAKVYYNTQLLHKRLGASFLKYFAFSICFVASKYD